MSQDQYESIKVNIIEKCQLLMEIDYFVGTWGNISVRVPEGLIITPSKIAYDAMVPSDLVTISKEGTILAGDRVPSSETELHRALLNKRDDIGAIIHAHSPYASALSCLHRPIPPFVEDLVQIAGGQVNCTHYVHGGDHRGVAQEVVRAIGDGNAVLLANHGVVCCGRDLDEAFVTCQVVEKAALMMLAAASVGPMVPIPDEHVRSERYRFLHLYGTAEDSPGSSGDNDEISVLEEESVP